MTRILALILLSTLVSCGQTAVKEESDSKPDETNPNWKKLEEANYSIHYPPEWELNKSGQMGTSLILFSPLESNQDQFKENINLMIQNLSGQNIDLDKYTEISEGQIKTMLTNPILIESKRIRNGTDEYHRMIYTGDQGIYHLKFEQYYWVLNDQAYLLTFTCEENTFSDYKETGEKILNSFTINK